MTESTVFCITKFYNYHKKFFSFQFYVIHDFVIDGISGDKPNTCAAIEEHTRKQNLS